MAEVLSRNGVSGETVIVGCHLPNGIILEFGYSVVAQRDDANGAGGGHMQVTRHDDYARVTLNGWNSNIPKDATGRRMLLPASHINAPGKTVVSKAFWDRWSKEHERSPMIKKGILFVAKNETEFTAKAMDYHQLKTGLEPVVAGQARGITTLDRDGVAA